MKGRQTLAQETFSASSEGDSDIGTAGTSKKLLLKFFKFNLQLLKAEETFCTMRVTKLFLFVYLFITGLGLIEWRTLKNKYLIINSTIFDGAIRAVITVFMGVLVILSAVAMFRPLKINSKVSLLDHLVVWGKFLHIYVVLPICFWLYSGELFDWGNLRIGINKLQLAFTWTALLLGMMIAVGFTSIRNTLPSASKITTPGRFSEFSIYAFFLILTCIGNNLAGTTTEMAWDLTSIIASGLCAIFYTSTQTFWYYSVNTWYICGHLSILIIRLCLLVLRAYHKTPNLLEILVFCAIPFVLSIKGGKNLCELLLKGRIMLVSKQSPAQNLPVFVEYELVQQIIARDPNQLEISPSLLFKFSLIGELLKKNKYYDDKWDRLRTAEFLAQQSKKSKKMGEMPPPADPLFMLQEIMISTRAITPESVYIQLILQIIFIEQNLLRFSVNLANYRKSMAGSAWGLLTYYLLEALVRGRLTTIATSSAESKNNKMNVFSEIFRELSGNSSAIAADSGADRGSLLSKSEKKKKHDTSLGKKLDLEQVFSCKHSYLKLVGGVNQFTTVKCSIFSQLIEKHNLKSSLGFSRNKLARTLGNQLDQSFSALAGLDNAPNYMLATSICYFLKLRHDSEKAEKIFRTYQARLSKLLHISSDPGEAITEVNFLYSSVVMKIDVSSDLQLGMIKDITPNYREHLGEPEEGDPTRVNINTLFPGSMSSSHTKMMKATKDQPIFNRQREFQINGFDGHLRPLSFVLKLDSAVSGGLHALALLRFPEDGRSNLALVSDKLELTTAENNFWQVLGKITVDQATGEYLTDDLQSEQLLTDVCPTLSIQIKFFEFLRTEAANSDSLIQQRLLVNVSGTGEGNPIVVVESAPDMRSSVSDAEEYSYNRLKKRVFDTAATFEHAGVGHLYIAQTGTVSRSMKLLSGITRVQKTSFGDQTYYRIWVTFDLNYNKEARKMKTYQVGPDRQAKLKGFSTQAGAARDRDSGEEVGGFDSSQNLAQDDDDENLGQELIGLDVAGSFEHLLKRLKSASPIVSLVSEALGKNYPSEIKAALTWIQEFYKASEAAEHNPSASKSLNPIKSLYSSVMGNGGMTSTNKMSTLAGSPVRDITGYEALRNALRGVEGQNSNIQPSTSSLAEIAQKPSNVLLQEEEYTPIQAETNRYPSKGPFDQMSSLAKPAKGETETFFTAHKATISIVDVNTQQRLSAGMTLPGKKPQNIIRNKLKKAGQTLRESRTQKMRQSEADIRPPPTVSAKEYHQQPQRPGGFVPGEKHDSDDKGIMLKSWIPGDVLIGMAQAQAFTSQNAANLQIINQQLSEFKGVKRAELSPDGDKNNSVSVSTKTSSSKGSHLLKIVRSTQETSKSAAVEYFFSIGLAAFSVAIIVLLQFVFSSLLTYNTSNTSNFLLVSQFVFLDRKVIQAAEIQTLMYSHVSQVFNKTSYEIIVSSYEPILPANLNSTEYLFSRLDEAQDTLLNTLESIVSVVTYGMQSTDIPLANDAVFRNTPLQYVDRFIDLASVYKAWVVPYFTSIYYFVDLVRWNLVASKQINQLALDTDFVFELTPSQEIDWVKVTNARLGRDRTVFGSNLKEMEPLFAQVVDDIIVTAVDRHFASVYLLFYITLALLGLMLAYNIYIAYQINEIQKGLLSNYTLLRAWEIVVQIEEISRLKEVFVRYTFNEMHLISEYFDFGLISQQVAFNKRINNLQEKFSKEKDKVSGGYRFAHNFYFFSSKWSFFSWIMAALCFAVMGLSFSNFLSINDQRIGAEMLIFQSHRLLLGVTKNYISLLLMILHGYNLDVAGTKIADDAFSTAIDDFLVFQTGKRREFINYFGTARARIIDEISFGNICGLMSITKSMKAVASDFESVCLRVNQASATKGIVGFLQYQKQFIESMKSNIRSKYADWLTKSVTTRPTEGLIAELFSKNFNELRVANWMLYNVYYSLVSDIVTEVANDIKDQLDQFIGQIMQYISIGLYLILLIGYFYLFRAQWDELDICYETFKLIDPYFLMSNRYLQHKFKSAFKGVE